MEQENTVSGFKRHFDSEKNAIYLTPIEGTPTHTLIWLHGAGEPAELSLNLFGSIDGSEFPSMLPHSNIQVILPNAPMRPCTWYFDDAIVPVWSNINEFNGETFVYDRGQFDETILRLSALIDEEVLKHHHGDYGKLFIGGYS